MSQVPGLLALAGLGGLTANPNVTSDHWGFAWVNQFDPVPYLNASPEPLFAPAASALPVSAAPRQAAGVVGNCFFNDYYFRIHIAPQQIDLGNVVSTQTTPLHVWNANFEPRTLTSIDPSTGSGQAEGIIVSGQPAPPLLYMPLQERQYELSVTPDGAPNVDTEINWVFSTGEQPGAGVTAVRIIGWAFAPDWRSGNDGISETLEWATDIMASETLVEQRRALRQAPRREFEAGFYAGRRERQYLDMVLYGWSARVWALPIWPDIQQIAFNLQPGSLIIPCLTTDLDFRPGGMAMLRSAEVGDIFSAEVVEIEAVQPAGLTLKRPTERYWPVASRLYPARSAQLTELPRLTRHTDQLDGFSASFRIVEASDWAATPPSALYRNRPVLTARPNESEELTHEFTRLLAILDNTAAAPVVTDVGGLALPVQRHRWLGHGRAGRAAWRSLLYWFNGRQRAAWIPTHADDITLIDVTPATATNVNIAYIGYTRFAQSRPGRRDIRIELSDGTALHRRITGSREVDANTERLELDAAPGVALSPAPSTGSGQAYVTRISYMALCRQDSDSVEIRHLTDSEGAAESEVIFRGVRDDEF